MESTDSQNISEQEMNIVQWICRDEIKSRNGGCSWDMSYDGWHDMTDDTYDQI